MITVRDFSPHSSDGGKTSCKKEEMLLQRKSITSKTIQKFVGLRSLPARRFLVI